MTINEQMNFDKERHEKSVLFMNKAINENNFMLALLNANVAVQHLLELGILQWRANENPRATFQKMMGFYEHSQQVLNSFDAQSAQSSPIDTFEIVYIAFLIDWPISQTSLVSLEGQPKIDAFLGNVLTRHDNINNWNLYKDILLADRRHDLARRTNALYVDLLKGNAPANEGVQLGESLWAEREDDSFFADGLSGNGLGNERMVDYKLAAILKKIGSTVPTVHAWRW